MRLPSNPPNALKTSFGDDLNDMHSQFKSVAEIEKIGVYSVGPNQRGFPNKWNKSEIN